MDIEIDIYLQKYNGWYHNVKQPRLPLQFGFYYRLNNKTIENNFSTSVKNCFCDIANTQRILRAINTTLEQTMPLEERLASQSRCTPRSLFSLHPRTPVLRLLHRIQISFTCFWNLLFCSATASDYCYYSEKRFSAFVIYN